MECCLFIVIINYFLQRQEKERKQQQLNFQQQQIAVQIQQLQTTGQQVSFRTLLCIDISPFLCPRTSPPSQHMETAKDKQSQRKRS